jgi:phage-related protein
MPETAVARRKPAKAPVREPTTVPAGVPPEVATTLRAPGRGEPLPREALIRLESGLGADLEHVRVHADGPARSAAARLGARAFAFGRRIFLGPGQSKTDLALLAHEAAHVVQQQSSSATVQLFGDTAAPALEREAASAGAAVAAGSTAQVHGRTGAAIQRDADTFLGIDWKGLVREHAPGLAEVFIDRTPLQWLELKIVAAFEAIVAPLRKPLETAVGFIGELKRHFADLVAWMRESAGQIAKGDCSSLAKAAERIEGVFAKLSAPIVDKVKELAGKVGAFFTGLWEKVGAPVWEWIKQAAGTVWDTVSKLASRAWEAILKIKDKISWFGARAWAFVKDKLGLKDAGESEGGLLDWIKAKAQTAWDNLKRVVEPYKKQLAVVAGILVMLSPAGPLIAIGAAVVGFIQAVRWLAKNLSKPEGVVSARTHVRDVVIGGIRKALARINEILRGAAAFLTKTLKQLTGGIGAAAGKLAGSVLSFLVSAAEWLLEKFEALSVWAVDQVAGLADLVDSALAKLNAWLDPVYKVLGRVGDVLARAAEVVFMVAEKVWNLIPACLRDPIVNFLVENLLKKIPIVAAILDVPDIWARVKELVRTIIRKLFKGLDLLGAALEIFKLLLDVLKVPIDLVTGIFKKAGTALDTILANPVAFLRNLLTALKAGLQGFVDRFWTHLRNGLVGWLSGELPPGIKFPTDFSLSGIFGFVFAVLGVTMEKVWEIIKKRVSPAVFKALQAAARIAAGVWEFVTIAITEGVAGLWRKLTEKLEELKQMVLDAIIGWVVKNIIERIVAKLISMLDPTGIMAVVNSIIAFYNAIQAAVEYIRGILEIVDKYLDMVLGIATGAIGAAAQRFEGLLARAMPIAIGFLGYQVGLNKVGKRIREMIVKLQTWVEEKLDALVTKAVKAGGNVITAITKALGGGKAEGKFKSDDGQGHRVYMEEGTDRWMVASIPGPLKDLLVKLKDRIEKEVPEDGDMRKEAMKAHAAAAREAAKVKPGEATPEKQAEILGRVYEHVGHPKAPKSVLTWTPKSALAKVAKARPLTRTAPKDGAGEASTSAVIAAETRLKTDPIKSTNKWVKLHLISFRLHGRDLAGNFAPGDKVVNSAMEKVEAAAVSKLKDNDGRNVMHYTTTVTYRPSPDEHFPAQVKMVHGEMDKAGTKETSSTTQVFEVPSPPKKREQVPSLSSASIGTLQAAGVPSGAAWHIANGRRNVLQRPFTALKDIDYVLNHPDPGRTPAPAGAAAAIKKLIADGDLTLNDQP